MLSPEDEKLKNLAKQWVKANRRKLIAKFCDMDQYPKASRPITIFMAGTPGAGKTEFSISLLERFDSAFVRIDADDIREMMREIGYNGTNAEVFQDAANKAVNILFDFANKKGGQNVLLDGTFSYGNWRENVERSIAHGRTVEIYYLYQDPIVAWDYVKKREQEHGRAVPLEAFLKSYELSVINVQRAIKDFGENLTVYFAKNDYTKNIESIAVDVDDIEKLLPTRYNREELQDLLHAPEAN
ncbi:MAG: zeta toxin family protein [Patescibacteria group bacterium]